MENLKSTAFAVIVIVLMIIFALIKGDPSSDWNAMRLEPVSAGQYLAIDEDKNICVLEYSPQNGWMFPVGVDPQEIDFDISALAGWQDVG